MKKHNILILTDHSNHSEQNSIYAMTKELYGHEQTKSILIASRGITENDDFFQYKRQRTLKAIPVDQDYRYTASGALFSENLVSVKPAEIDFVLMRIPRPISDTFLIWLEKVFFRAVIVNKPSGIVKTSSKEFLLNFPEQCPSMKFVKSVQEILDFAKQFPIVLKPLKEYGGKGLLRIDGNTLDDGAQKHETEPYLQNLKYEIELDGYLAMKFLKNVTEGDKRILVVGGEIMAASLRKPAEGSWLCNVAQGGTSHATEITPEEQEIIAAISPVLTAAGILIFGADTLVDDDGKRILSEVNTLSIGGFPQAEKQTGRPIIKQTINKIFEYVDDRS